MVIITHFFVFSPIMFAPAPTCFAIVMPNID